MNQKDFDQKASMIVEIVNDVYALEMTKEDLDFSKGDGALEFLMGNLYTIVFDIEDGVCPPLGNDDVLAKVVEKIVEDYHPSLWGKSQDLTDTAIAIVGGYPTTDIDIEPSVYEFYADLYDC